LRSSAGSGSLQRRFCCWLRGRSSAEARAEAAGGDAALQAQLATAVGGTHQGVGHGGVLTLETLALLDAMLSQHKLSAYEHYLHAASLALSVAVGLLTALIEMLTSIKFSR